MQSLAVAAVVAVSGIESVQAASPIAFEADSYNVDLVYENVPVGSLSIVTGTQDDDSLPSQPPEQQTGGDDRTWPETGLIVRGVVSSGLPSNRVVSANGTSWQLMPYTENNVMQLQNWGRSNPLSRTMTLKPEARVPYGKLDVLLAAAPENVAYGVMLHFTDGTSADLGQSFVAIQWGSEDMDNRVFGSNRVSANLNYPSPFPATIRAGSDDGVAGGGNYGINHREFDLAAAGLHQMALHSITFTNYTSSNLSIFAVSGVALASALQPPALSILPWGSGVEVRWDRGVLQDSADLTGPWNDLPYAVSPWFRDAGGPQRFFRVRY